MILSGTLLIIVTSFARYVMNQFTSKILAKSLYSTKKVAIKRKNCWLDFVHCNQNIECKLESAVYLSSFQKEWWSNSGTTSVALRILATTTASVIWRQEYHRHFQKGVWITLVEKKRKKNYDYDNKKNLGLVCSFKNWNRTNELK